MTSRVVLAAALTAGLAWIAGCAQQSNPEAQRAAEGAARSWLALVDAGNYAGSWDAAAPYFRNAVAKEQWEKSLTAIRTPLGAVKSRELKSARYRTTLPGAPDGEYVVIQYSTSFEKKKTAIETVTPMLCDDGRWLVSGYFIK
jgi:hypothetical protein